MTTKPNLTKEAAASVALDGQTFDELTDGPISHFSDHDDAPKKETLEEHEKSCEFYNGVKEFTKPPSKNDICISKPYNNDVGNKPATSSEDITKLQNYTKSKKNDVVLSKSNTDEPATDEEEETINKIDCMGKIGSIGPSQLSALRAHVEKAFKHAAAHGEWLCCTCGLGKPSLECSECEEKQAHSRGYTRNLEEAEMMERQAIEKALEIERSISSQMLTTERENHAKQIEELITEKNEAVEKAVGETLIIISLMKNPYPKDIFTQPTEQETRDYVKLLQEHGFSSDAIHGTWGREVWEMAKCKAVEEIADKWPKAKED